MLVGLLTCREVDALLRMEKSTVAAMFIFFRHSHESTAMSEMSEPK